MCVAWNRRLRIGRFKNDYQLLEETTATNQLDEILEQNKEGYCPLRLSTK